MMRFALSLILLVVSTLSGPAGMSPATASAQRAIEVLADGLEGPRGLAFGPDGALYVAEAGRGGDECVESPEPPAFGNPRLCFGRTGAVTRLIDGRQEKYATGLPSHTTGGQVTGPQDLVVSTNGDIFLTMGYAQDPVYRGQLSKSAALMGRLLRIREGQPAVPVADLAGHELAANPEEAGGDHSNPFGLAIDGAGFVVTDSAGNDLLRVGRGGTIETLAVFPPQMVEGPPREGSPPGTLVPMASVPTSVAIGPDGAYYVGEFTGFPFTIGTARIWRVVPGEAPEIFAGGFTAIIDLTFSEDGRLYVLEAVQGGLGAINPADPASLTGALIRVEANGARTVVDGQNLIFPTSLAFGPDGLIYVTNNGIVPGRGQVVRLQS